MATYLNFDVGGRPYNSQDFASLQNQLIDATKIYAAYNNGNNYIVEGIALRGASGTVWLAGKVRAVQADPSINNSTPFPVWILAQDSQVARVYKDGQAKVAFNVFNGAWSTTPPGIGVSFLQFNSQQDLDKTRLISFITPDAVPVSGGVYTGPIDAPLVTTNGGLGGILLPESPASDNNRYRFGLGMNLQYNGSNWIAKGDGSNNGGGIIVSDIFGTSINFGIVTSSNGSNQFFSPIDIDNSYKMTISSGGDLTVARNISASNGSITAQSAIIGGQNVNNAIATAQSSANAANSAASAAQSSANTANSAASAAQSTANSAISAAANAQSTANTANSAASAASTAAANAQSTANTAQGTANIANSAATAAQTTANAAQAAVSALTTVVSNLSTQVSDFIDSTKIFSTGSITTSSVTPVSSNGSIASLFRTITVPSRPMICNVFVIGAGLFACDSGNDDLFTISITNGLGTLLANSEINPSVNVNGGNFINSPGQPENGFRQAETLYVHAMDSLPANTSRSYNLYCGYFNGGTGYHAGSRLTVIVIPQ